MSRVTNTFVTVVFVVDGYAKDIGDRVGGLVAQLKKAYANYEVVLVDNGLTMDDLADLRKMLKIVPCIRILRLAKNYDTDTAIFAGIEASIGDYICVLYDNDPIEIVADFVCKTLEGSDLVFGVAKNLQRRNILEQVGASLFYWYSKRYMRLNVPNGATYFMCMNRSAANALTRSGRYVRRIRQMAQQVGFTSKTLEYDLPAGNRQYSHATAGSLVVKAIDLISNYSSHPLRVLSYFGIIAGLLNVLYAVYVVVVNLSLSDVARGWTTLSLQSSSMFFVLFLILALLAEYIGKILNETQQEPPYHIMQELSSTISIADETRLNVTK